MRERLRADEVGDARNPSAASTPDASAQSTSISITAWPNEAVSASIEQPPSANLERVVAKSAKGARVASRSVSSMHKSSHALETGSRSRKA